jgi:Xaa-Pro aminopeptidase
MNSPNAVDFAEKTKRLREYMDRSGYGAVLLARRDNVAWLTGGGDFKVLRDTETAFGVLLVTQDQIYLVAQSMDLDRIYDDELAGLGIEKVSLRWYEESREDKAVKLAGGVKVVSDSPVAGEDCKLWDIYWLHYPLTDSDISVYRQAAKTCDEMIYTVANRIEPGMTEQQIEADVIAEYARENFTMKVVLVGSDERIAMYRHPNASSKKLEKVVLIHPASSYRGLHVNITRMVCFGDIPAKLSANYDLLNLLEAHTMAMMRPGTPFMDLFEERKRILAAHDMADEWKCHYPGALTGYVLGSAQPFLNGELIRDRMSMDNFLTVKGAKVEEISISGENGAELISAGHVWPTKTYSYKNNDYALPIILQR